MRIRPTPTPAAATDADALHANARMQAGCLFGKHADERQHAQVLHLAGILNPCPLVLVLARPSVPMLSPACVRAGRFCRVPDRLDHPCGWTVVDTTSMYSNKTTLKPRFGM